MTMSQQIRKDLEFSLSCGLVYVVFCNSQFKLVLALSLYLRSNFIYKCIISSPSLLSQNWEARTIPCAKYSIYFRLLRTIAPLDVLQEIFLPPTPILPRNWFLDISLAITSIPSSSISLLEVFASISAFRSVAR